MLSLNSQMQQSWNLNDRLFAAFELYDLVSQVSQDLSKKNTHIVNPAAALLLVLRILQCNLQPLDCKEVTRRLLNVYPPPLSIKEQKRTRKIDPQSQLLTQYQLCTKMKKGRDAKKEVERRRQEIQTYVRHKLFPGWKFFTSEKQIAFSDNKGSIILKICNDLAVRKEHRHAWWDKNRKLVVQSLNQKRNDVTNYCKKIFIGTFKTTVSYLPSTIAVANTTVLLVYVYLHGEQVSDLLCFMCCDFL